MSRPLRSASPRGVTPRPRKIAGQSLTVRAPEVPEAEEHGSTPEVEEVAQRPSRDRSLDTGHHPPAMLASPTTTRVLIGVLAALALVLAALAVWWVVDDDPAPALARAAAGHALGVDVPPGRPVVADTLAVQGGVEAAAKATQELLSVVYSNYNEELGRAVELMTTQYEDEYRRTIGDVKEEAVAQNLVVQSKVVAQGVVRANRTELEALVFLNQVTQRTRDGKSETVATPFKALVTMVHTDQGWRVDGLAADEPERAPAD